MMRRSGSLAMPALLFALTASFGLNRGMGPEIERRRSPTTMEQELSFYPSGKLLRPLTAGLQNVAADLLWLRAIQYYGEHRKTDLVFDKAAHVFRVLTDLDPGFVEAYRFGALVVIEDAHQPGEGYALLRKGIRENPGRGELLFDLGFHHFLADEFDAAATYFHRAAELDPGNERVVRFAAFAEKRRGGLDQAEEMWREILRTTENDQFREAAKFALLGIRAARDTTAIAAGCREFRERHGRWPGAPEELVRAGILGAAPVEPYGERYVIQPETGEVRSSFLLAREVKRDLGILQGVVDRFRSSRGRLPVDPQETVDAGMLLEVTEPWGIRYEVDAANGRVRAKLGERELTFGEEGAS
ncbi:MAG: hypothetical protein ABIK65_03625 [Candidatus Eisenbacteria bacterium]